MRWLTFAAALIAGLSAPVSANAQSYIYNLVNTYGPFTPGTTGPQTQPILQVLSATTQDHLASLGLSSTGSATDIVLGAEDRRAYVAVQGPAAGVAGALYIVDTLSLTIAKTVTFATGAPTALALSADRSRLYIGRQSPDRITVLRTSDDTAIDELDVPGQPRALALSPDTLTLYVATAQPSAIAVVDLATRQVIASIPLEKQPRDLALAPDGGRLYVGASNSFIGAAGSLYAVDTGSRQVVASVEASANPNGLALSPDGRTLYAANNLVTGGFGNFGQVEVLETAGLTRTALIDACGPFDVAIDASASRAYATGSCGVHSVGSITVIDTATARRVTSTSTGIVLNSRIAVGKPAGCTYELTPSVVSFGPSGGTGQVAMTATAGCAWTISTPANWIQFTSAASGTGPGTVSFTVSPSTGDPRSARLTSGFQSVLVRQTQPLTWIDEPASGTTVNQPFMLRGWAIDREDVTGSDTGVDAVDVWAYPGSGAAPIFLGRPDSYERPDVAAAFGSSRYLRSGFSLQVRGLAPGVYQIVAFAHSARTGAYHPASTVVTVENLSNPAGAIDAPREGESLSQPFVFAGWAADLAKASGTGVDAVHVWAYPDGGGAPVFVGAARYGEWDRPDVASALNDGALKQSGYLLLVNGLAPGGYTFVAFAHSTVTGAFTPRVVRVNVLAGAQPVIHIDEVRTGNGGAFFGPYVQVSGWSVDTRAATGVGVSAIHVWAYPVSGGAPTLVGAANLGVSRDITALLFGAQFTTSGWYVSGALPAGRYRLAVFALSSVTGKFDNVRVVDVTVQ